MNKKIAVPTQDKLLTAHFGHCDQFAIVYINDSKIVKSEYIRPPVHQPGVYPKFLSDLGVDVIIAGGMGQQAQSLFAQQSIQVIVGVGVDTPEKLAQDYILNQLSSGENQCDH